MVCQKWGRLVKAVIIFDNRIGNPANISEILKRRKKTYGNSKTLYSATTALWI
jgi:hypothetical protein